MTTQNSAMGDEELRKAIEHVDSLSGQIEKAETFAEVEKLQPRLDVAKSYASGLQIGLQLLASRGQQIALAAQIDEAEDIRKNIQDLGSPVYLALERIDGHIAALKAQNKEK